MAVWVIANTRGKDSAESLPRHQVFAELEFETKIDEEAALQQWRIVCWKNVFIIQTDTKYMLTFHQIPFLLKIIIYILLQSCGQK